MVQACLIGLIASLGVFGDQLGSLYINRPIILAPLHLPQSEHSLKMRRTSVNP